MKTNRPPARRKISQRAKKVFQGEIYSVHHWKQKEFDGTYKIYEALKRNDSVEVYPVSEDGKIMLGVQNQPDTKTFIAGFGGKMEKGETPEVAVKREFLEETGYEYKKLIPWFSRQPMGRIDWVIYVYIARGIKKISNPTLDSGEKIMLKFVDLEEFIKLTTKDSFRNWMVSLQVYKTLMQKDGKNRLKKLFFG